MNVELRLAKWLSLVGVLLIPGVASSGDGNSVEDLWANVNQEWRSKTQFVSWSKVEVEDRRLENQVVVIDGWIAVDKSPRNHQKMRVRLFDDLTSRRYERPLRSLELELESLSRLLAEGRFSESKKRPPKLEDLDGKYLQVIGMFKFDSKRQGEENVLGILSEAYEIRLLEEGGTVKWVLYRSK